MTEEGESEPEQSRIRSLLAPYLTANGLAAFRNLSSLMVAAGVAQFCGLIGVLLLTRSLGAERYGVFAFALTMQNYLMILGSAGLRPIIVRELIRRPESLNQLWTAYISITGLFGTLLAALTIGLATILAPTSTERIVLAVIAVGNIAACLTPLPFYDFRHAQSRSALIVTVAEVAALILLLVLYATSQLSLPAAACVFAGKWISSAVFLWLGVRVDLPGLRWDWSSSEAIQLLASSWKLVLSALLSTIPLTGGILLVRFYHGDAAAGIFGVAMYAPRVLLLLTGQLNRVLQPHIVSSHGRTRRFVRRLICTYMMLLAISSLGLLIGLWYMVTTLLSSSFSPALASGSIMLLEVVSKPFN